MKVKRPHRIGHVVRGVFGLTMKALAWLFTSERAARALTVMASLVTIIGLPLILLQLNDLPDQRASRTVQILMGVDQQLSAGA
jgi:hypothetical protein